MSAIGYVTLEEADLYVYSRYTAIESLRVSWAALDDATKTVLLQKSLDDIEQLPFVGRKTIAAQTLAFPRYPSATPPEAVKHAQIENALASADSGMQDDAELYRKMITWGIRSYSMGGLSESLGGTSQGDDLASNYNIMSAKARIFLKPFLSGGYRV